MDLRIEMVWYGGELGLESLEWMDRWMDGWGDGDVVGFMGFLIY